MWVGFRSWPFIIISKIMADKTIKILSKENVKQVVKAVLDQVPGTEDFAPSTHKHVATDITDLPDFPVAATDDEVNELVEKFKEEGLQNVVYPLATPQTDGLMSASDKAKLDGMSDSLTLDDIPVASATNAGLMSAENCNKLSAMPAFWKGTQSEYDALGVYDNNTLYLITE